MGCPATMWGNRCTPILINTYAMMRAMIFAAGMGTRLKPLTDYIPKALVPVGGIPLLDIQIEKLKAAGCQEIVVNIHHFADLIERHVRSRQWGAKVRLSDERTLLLDTGGGLRHAAPLFAGDDDNILLHNVDILSNADLAGLYARGREHDAVLLVSHRPTQRYLLFNESLRLVGWTHVGTGEVKTPYAHLDVAACRKYAFAGIHVFSPRLFKEMSAWPERFSIVDFYLSVCHRYDIYGCPDADLRLLDVGKQDTLRQAEAFMQAGVDKNAE